MSTTDPRVEAAVMALRRIYGPNRTECDELVALVLDAADKADPLRDRKKLITRMAVGISKSHATQEPILSVEENGGMISVRLPDLATAILGGER